MQFGFKDFPAERLYKISKRIVDLAFFMGGYKVKYYEAERCNYTFPDGKKCFNTHTLSPSIHCPVCKGTGVIYREPVEIRALLIDQSETPRKKLEGIEFIDNLRMVVPAEIPVKLIKLESTGRMFFVRDRFDVYTSAQDNFHSVFVNSEPKDVWLAGVLYKSFSVVSSRQHLREAVGDESIRPSGVKEEIERIAGVKLDKKKEEENIEEIIRNIIDGD